MAVMQAATVKRLAITSARRASHQFVDGIECKRCSRCKEPRPLSEFHAHAARWDGLQRLCVQCSSENARAWLARRHASGQTGKTRLREGQRHARRARLANGRHVRARLFQIWESMWQRCTRPQHRRYERYGGRGIRICDEWQSYDAFRAWAISHGYAKGLTLDRRENDDHYEPNNCRWIPAREQAWNTRQTIRLTHNGVTKALPQWASEMGVAPSKLRDQRRAGWTDEEILSGMKPKGFSR